MARGPDEKALKAKKMYQAGLKPAEIAKKLNVAEGTIRSWKSRYGWNKKNQSATQQNCNALAQQKCNAAKGKKSSAAEKEDIPDSEELNEKQQLFCVFYVRCFNATKAYMKAYGCDYAAAATNACKLLKTAKIKSYIKKLKINRINRELLKEEDIFQKYMDIAFSDMGDYVEWGQEEEPVKAPDGSVLTMRDQNGASQPITRKVNYVRFKDSGNVDGTLVSEVRQGRNGASIKLSDRMKALDWLTEHMEMATEKQRAELEFLRHKADGDGGEAAKKEISNIESLISQMKPIADNEAAE